MALIVDGVIYVFDVVMMLFPFDACEMVFFERLTIWPLGSKFSHILGFCWNYIYFSLPLHMEGFYYMVILYVQFSFPFESFVCILCIASAIFSTIHCNTFLPRLYMLWWSSALNYFDVMMYLASGVWGRLYVSVVQTMRYDGFLSG